MTFHIGWPQAIYVFLLVVGVVVSIVKHGEPRAAHNGVERFLDAVLSVAILYWGGFFK